jgi:peptide/nickel transport system substrate-binding protein
MARVPRRVLAAVSAGLAMGLTLTACGGGGKDAGSVAQTVVVGAYNSDTLDPGAPSGFLGPSLPIAQGIYGTLFDPPKTENGTFVPDLATGYQYAKDNKSLTITLRQGVTFQDGTPFDAAAVAYSFDRYKSHPSPSSQYFEDMASAAAVDNHTVRVTFDRANTFFIPMVTYTSGGLIASPTAIKKSGEKNFGLNPIGAGPFKVTRHQSGQELDLAPFGGFWAAKKVSLTSLRYINTSADSSVAYKDVVAGSIDEVQVNGASTPPNVLDEAKNNAQIKTVSGPDNGYTFMALNTSKPPFDTIEARQAIDYCTNRESIAKGITGGWTKPAYVVAGPDTQYYPAGGPTAAKAQFPYPYDPAKGKALVQQMGGLSFDFVNLGGQALTLSNALAQTWKACGIKATVQAIQGPKLAQALQTGDFQMVLTPEAGLSDPHFYRSFDRKNTPQGSHTTIPLKSDIPAIVQSANGTTDKTELAGIYAHLWTEINKQAATIPLVSSSNYYFQNKCLAGIDLSGFGANFKYAKKTC